MNSCVPSGKSKPVEITFFRSFLTLITCSQSFLLENFTIVRSLFLLRRWHDPIFSSQVSAPISYKTLHTVFSRLLCTIELCMLIISAHSLRQYCAFLPLPFKGSQLFHTRALFTFLPTSTSDSSLLKLAFKFFNLISSLRCCNVSVFLHFEK